MPDLKLTLACWNYDRTRALMDGSVKPEGIELTYHNSFPAATFHRMVGKREFEASELGLTFYLDTLHYDDPPFVAIPVYPIRVFSHSAIYINTNKGIREPKDLIGRKVGEFFLYGHDAGTWSKGILQDHYGVPIDSYDNYIGGVERPTPPLPWYQEKPPAHIKVQHIGTETTLDQMLDAGEIDALFSALVPPSLGAQVEKRGAAVSGFRDELSATTTSRPASSRSSMSSRSARTSIRPIPGSRPRSTRPSRRRATRRMRPTGISRRTCTACS